VPPKKKKKKKENCKVCGINEVQAGKKAKCHSILPYPSHFGVCISVGSLLPNIAIPGLRDCFLLAPPLLP
jgi:hypothetical protein